ncbi:MAG: hypothetical protein WBZ24_06545 [Anaerolineales bacterium]|jgi:hypothetical protein
MSPEADHYESDADGTRSKGPISALIRDVVLGALRWLFELPTLSETDQLEAGIFLGGQGRD